MSEHWVRVAEFSLDENLSILDLRLKQLKVTHRFTEGEGKQHLWVSSSNDLAYVKSILDDKVSVDVSQHTSSSLISANFSIVFKVPFTLSFLLLGAIGFVLNHFKIYGLRNQWLFVDFDTMFAELAYWRLVTPAFLHFDIMHYVFNALWIWVVGQRLESFLKWRAYLLLFLVSAISGNVLQYLALKQLGFGGLSGVVYAFLGCIFVLYRKYPVSSLAMPSGVFGFMLFWLILGFAGFIDYFIPGQVANWAHLGGLLAGVCFGAGYVFVKNAYENR